MRTAALLVLVAHRCAAFSPVQRGRAAISHARSFADEYPPPTAPSDTRRVRFSTTAGQLTVELDRALSPAGVDRFLALVGDRFFDGQLLYRVVPGFVVQFGIAADPALTAKWAAEPQLADEPNRSPFRRGSLSFAGNGVGSRTHHLFFALEPHGEELGGAPHETTLGWVDEADLYALEQIVSNHAMAGYEDTGHLATTLFEQGNMAAMEYPGLGFIERCELLD